MNTFENLTDQEIVDIIQQYIFAEELSFLEIKDIEDLLRELKKKINRRIKGGRCPVHFFIYSKFGYFEIRWSDLSKA